MDKLLRMLAALLTMFAMTMFSTSCSDDDDKDDEDKSIVNILVNSNGQPCSGITVYMFKSNVVNTFGFSNLAPIHARKSVVTEADGTAIFELDNFDLSTTDSQTTLYFVTFTQNTTTGKESQNHVAITIKKGETKSGTIKL